MSVSVSASDPCCIPSTCACDDWLTSFCDYETVTLKYCGVETQFTSARSKGMKMSAINPQSGIHPSDRIFSLSYNENDVEMGIGAVIVDADEVEWQVYAIDTVKAFCYKKMWARSVSACFCLMDSIEILEQDCTDESCDTALTYNRIAGVKGKVIAETASLRERNDARDLLYRYSAELVKWPKGAGDRPTSAHRIRTKEGRFRITGVRDGGPYVPFHVDLEIENAEC